MKPLFVIVLLIFVQSPPSPRLASDQSHSAQNAPSSQKSTVSEPEHQSNQPQTTRISELPLVSVRHDWIDKLSLATAITLAAVGVVGVWIANRTLKAILVQAEQMANQTRAERPWLFLAPYQFRLGPSNRFDWRIWNNGRTVATIIEVGGRCRKCRLMDKVLKPPPDYGTVSSFFDLPLAPGGSTDFWSYIEHDDDKTRGLTDRDIDGIVNKGDDLVAFGFVKYRDQDGGEHESRFCYYYAVPFQEFRINLRASAEYHKCT